MTKKPTPNTLYPSRINPDRARTLAISPQLNADGSPKAERVRFTNKEKLIICKRYYLVKPSLTQLQLCAWAKEEFQLAKEPSQSMISCILKRYEDLKSFDAAQLDYLSNKGAKFPGLERALVELVKAKDKSVWRLSFNSLRSEAERLCLTRPELLDGKDKPSFSHGWYDRFIKRNAVSCGLVKPKSRSPSVDMQDVVPASEGSEYSGDMLLEATPLEETLELHQEQEQHEEPQYKQEQQEQYDEIEEDEDEDGLPQHLKDDMLLKALQTILSFSPDKSPEDRAFLKQVRSRARKLMIQSADK